MGGANQAAGWLRGVEVAKYSPRLQDTVVHSPPAQSAKVVAPTCKKEGRKENEEEGEM